MNKLMVLFRKIAKLSFRIFSIVMTRIVYMQYNPYYSICLYKPDLNIKIISTDFTPNNKMPKYSSITPVLNEESTIKDVLQSIENQAIPPSEVIIIDGGSKDSTIEKIEEYKKTSKLNIVVLVSTIKRNIGAQRNMGLKHAAYEWIMNIDAGMELDKNYVANMLGPIGKFKNIDLVGGVPHAKKRDAYSFMFCQDEFFVDRIEPYGACVLYKKSIAEAIDGYPEYLTYAAEDTVFFYKYQKASKNWVFNRSAIILWEIPLGITNVKNKLGRYFLGGFESGFWPYMYYQYILYPLMYQILGRWSPNYSLFKEHYKDYVKQQADLEIKKRGIKGVCLIIAQEPIYSPRSIEYRNFAFKMVEDNYKVFFISHISAQLSDVILDSPPTLWMKMKSLTCSLIRLISNSSTADKTNRQFYLNTDITLLELTPYKYFSIKKLYERYGDFMHDAILLISRNDNKALTEIKQVKNYCPDLRIMYDTEIKQNIEIE